MEANNKLREALEKCANMAEQIDCQLGSSDETVYAFRYERCLAHNISECARAALSEPIRNCDMGTAEEQSERLLRFCQNHPRCAECPCCGHVKYNKCDLAWAQLPYEELENDGSKYGSKYGSK